MTGKTSQPYRSFFRVGACPGRCAAAYAGLIVGSIAVSGCAATTKEKEEAWKPKPLVTLAHLTTQPVSVVPNGYNILVPQPTKGLFPAPVAVTRVALEPVEDSAPVEPTLRTDPRNEFLQWNTALDDQMAVSEVFPIVPFDLGGGPAEPDQILAAFRALHARLGLIYAFNELSENESEMIGVLYDTTGAQPVATLHAHAASLFPPEDERAEPVDLWTTDSQALVRARFEQIVHACVRDLIRNDEREVVDVPAGWTPAGPVLPVEWPPRRFRTGR